MTYSKRFSSPGRDRATSLSMVFEILDQKKNKDFFIVETGCMRADHGQLALGDDGASTYIFDDFINFYDGEVVSVDINPDNVRHAQKMVSDDFEPDNPIPSQKHHLKELTAVMKNLRKGSIIMVDDNANTPEFEWFTKIAQGGKAGFVKEFMKDVGAELLLDEYQIIWRL